jgi:uncharacterized protein YhaN
MKVKEFSIRQYGPLPDIGRISLSDFNLFFGKNETGKTLVIDALVKMLFKQNCRIFERIDRVDGEPDGYLIIEDDKKKIKLPEKGDLTQITSITSSECRNVFIIRNSDLSIAHEGEFYTNVTDRLTGLRTKEISSIKEKLQEIGKLTKAESSASISDDSKWGKVKTKLRNARDLIGNINEIEQKIKEERFDQMEEELSKVTEEINEIEQKQRDLEDARKREKYEKCNDTLGKLKTALENLRGRNLEEIKKLESKLTSYEENKEKLSSQKAKSEFFTKATIISALLLTVSILGLIVNPLPFLFYLIVSFIVSTIIFGALEFSYVIKKVQLASSVKEIKSSASQLGVTAENVEEIRSNIQKVNENLKLKEGAEIRLDSYFGKKSEDLKENLSNWEREIDTLKEYKDKAKGLEYDEKKVTQLEKEKTEFSQKKDELQGKMKSLIEKLKEVERIANEILQLEGDYLHCDTSVDLNAIRGRLKDFIDQIETDKNNVLEVMKIFEEIEKEEEERVSHLFGKDSPISKYFSEITGSIYQEVEFMPEEKKIQVKLKSGETLDAEKLSGGAYDQLYLSIRLALGEKLLKGNKGFFIMDDPFIKADAERLQKQMDIIKRISESGWQIVYFSAKDEVKAVLEKDIKCNKVSYIEIPNIFS